MKEKAVLFGEKKDLVGVLSEVEMGAGQVAAKSFGVLLLNAGVLHRIGPFRMYVDLARALQAVGIPVLRFDFSGVGDSEARSDSSSESERVVKEARAAMDFLASRTGLSRFVLIGLCSGAYHAHGIALSDPRVAGAVFLDGYGFRNRKYYIHKALGYLSLRRWARFLGRRLSKLWEKRKRPGDDGTLTEPAAVVLSYDYDRSQFIADMRELIARRVRMLFVFTGGVNYYNYRNQMADTLKCLPFRSVVEIEYFPDAHHTYPMLEHRQRVLKRIVAWLESGIL